MSSFIKRNGYVLFMVGVMVPVSYGCLLILQMLRDVGLDV